MLYVLWFAFEPLIAFHHYNHFVCYIKRKLFSFCGCHNWHTERLDDVVKVTHLYFESLNNKDLQSQYPWRLPGDQTESNKRHFNYLFLHPFYPLAFISQSFIKHVLYVRLCSRHNDRAVEKMQSLPLWSWQAINLVWCHVMTGAMKTNRAGQGVRELAGSDVFGKFKE